MSKSTKNEYYESDQEILNMLSNALGAMVSVKTEEMMVKNDGLLFDGDYFNNSDAMFLCKLTTCFKTILHLREGVVGTVDEVIDDAEQDAELIERYFLRKQDELTIGDLKNLIKIKVSQVIEEDYADECYNKSDKIVDINSAHKENSDDVAQSVCEEIVQKIISQVEEQIEEERLESDETIH